MKIRFLLLTSAVAALSHPLAAATIAFDSPANIVSTNDVSLEGTLAYAYNLGNVSVPSRTVNGVTFVGLANTNGNADLTFSPGLLTGASNEGGTAVFIQ